jgi:adenylate kinase
MIELDKYLQKTDEVLLVSVIEVRVSEETARKRVLGRARGADDDEKVFNNRMKVYREPLEEIRNFYSSMSRLKVISGEDSIDKIVQEMESFINSRL